MSAIVSCAAKRRSHIWIGNGSSRLGQRKVFAPLLAAGAIDDQFDVGGSQGRFAESEGSDQKMSITLDVADGGGAVTAHNTRNLDARSVV